MWPDFTSRRFLVAVSNGDFTSANTLLIAPAQWSNALTVKRFSMMGYLGPVHWKSGGQSGNGKRISGLP
jgi:hypothetical protein